MRLINTKTPELVEFDEPDIPNYATLCHMWNSDEVSLSDFVAKVPLQSQGYQKIASFCALCFKLGLMWAWVDPFYIDKGNSSVLSVAINSMFRFYRHSNTCVAYLSDVPKPLSVPWTPNETHSFQASRWFTRGWTLQELSAPKRMIFYSSCWSPDEEKGHLADTISAVSGIEEN
jgi:hypothetical protein